MIRCENRHPPLARAANRRARMCARGVFQPETGASRPCERGGGRTRRPFDRLALAGAMDAKTPWFQSSTGRAPAPHPEITGDGPRPVPLGDVLPAGATVASNTAHFGSRGEMGTGLATRPLVRSAGGGDGCQRHAPSRQNVIPNSSLGACSCRRTGVHFAGTRLFRHRRAGPRRSACPAPISRASARCSCRRRAHHSWRGARRPARSRSGRRRRG